MTIKELKQEKADLETIVGTALMDFTYKTGITVTRMDIAHLIKPTATELPVKYIMFVAIEL